MLIIQRYILKGLLPPFLVNLLFLTVIFLMTGMLQITKLIVNYNVGLGTIALILTYSIPHFLVFVLPMSVMMAILLTLMRMSGDNEIIALKSGGVSLYRLVPPAVILALAGFLATLFMTVYGMPMGKLAISQLTYRMLASNTDIGLKPRTFNNRFKDVTLYVNEVDPKRKTMKDVFIEDRRNPKATSTIVAPEGVVMRDAEGRSARLRLFNGMINQVMREKQSANTIYFTTYDVNLNIAQMAKLSRYKQKDEDEMTLAELSGHIHKLSAKTQKKEYDDALIEYYKKKYNDALIEFHQKFSVPAACIALGLLAIPLGVELRSTRRSAGLGMGIFIFVLYYVLMTAGRVFGEMGYLHPAAGLWAPNILVGIGGAIMLVRTANEKPNYFIMGLRFLGDYLRRIALKILHRLGMAALKPR